jgi:RHS repeat-associated protein
MARNRFNLFRRWWFPGQQTSNRAKTPAQSPKLKLLELEQRIAPAFLGGFSVASADINGDSLPELITATGPGSGPHIQVFDGATGNLVRSFYAFDKGFASGITVAAGDLNGDNRAEIIVGAGEGGHSHIVAFDGATGEVVKSFYAFDKGFASGITVAAGDLNGDNRAEIIVGAGEGGHSHVVAFDGATGEVVRSFYAFDKGFASGITVAAGDLNGDNRAEIIVGEGEGGHSHIVAFDGATGEVVRSFYAFPKDISSTNSLAIADLNRDGNSEILAGSGPGQSARFRYFDGKTGKLIGGFTPYGASQGDIGGFWGRKNPAPAWIENGAFTVPQSGQAQTAVRVLTTMRETDYINEPGLYRIDSTDGRVGNLMPDDPGYAAAALATDRRQALRSDGTLEFNAEPGALYAFYLIQNGTFDDWSRANSGNKLDKLPLAFFSKGDLPDGFPHMQSIPGWGRFGWEDLTRGGDQDFNDTIGEIQVEEAPAQFDPELRGWTIAERGGSAGKRGSVVSENGQAVLREGDSFLTTLSRSFVAPGGPSTLEFTYAGLGFDTSSPGFINDAFEVALIDSAGNALVPVFSPGRDAFFNVTDGNVQATGSATTVEDQRVRVDLSSVPAGTAATLVFRLIGNDTDLESSVTLASVELPSGFTADAPVQFFVVNADSQTTFRYGEEGLGGGHFVDTSLASPTGVASNPAGDKVWVVDSASHQVRVYGPTGGQLGAWVASDAVIPTGVTVDNGTLWLVDRALGKVLRYTGGAVMAEGTAASTSSFALDPANSSPSDLVTDGATVWVTDDSLAEVFVYDVAGALLGRWKLDGDNAKPSGITRNPAGGTDLWVLDRATHRVFQYGNGSSLRAGQHGADGTFDLAPGNTSPEGIADPPVTDPNDPREWQGATIGSFAALYYGENSELNRNRLVSEKVLDDGTINLKDAFSATLIAHPGISSGFSTDLTGTGSFDWAGGGASAEEAANFVDNQWVQTSGLIGQTVFELKFPAVKAAVFPTIDHGPLPQEAIESSIYLSNDRVAWTEARVQRVWLEGWHPNLGIKWDGFVYAVGTGTNETFKYVSVIHGGPGAFHDDGDDEINAIVGLDENFEPTQPEEPSISVGSNGLTFQSETTTLLTGLATAYLSRFVDGSRVPNRIDSVTVNGVPVDALDESGNFWSSVTVRPGENRFTCVATDAYGLTAETSIILTGENQASANLRMSQFADLSAGFKAEYSRTSYRQNGRELHADISVRNTSNYPVGVPLYVGVRNLSDPAVKVLNAAGQLPDGTPYYDFTGLVASGAKQLDPNGVTGTLSLSFANPNRDRFTYDLVFMGIPNRPPAFTSVPLLEATVGKLYTYPASATDPDGDALSYTLTTGPQGMIVDGATGRVQWTPAPDQAGNHPVVVRVADGRGGWAEQVYTVEAAASRANRPPVFVSQPAGAAQVGQTYRYDADATDPDNDPLTYSLATGAPLGMAIDPASGLITWTPDASQMGDTNITVSVADGRGGTAAQNYTICVRNDGNRAPVIVSEPITFADKEATQTTNPTPVNLRDWSVIQYDFNDQGPSQWELDSIDPTVVTQRRNADASIFLSDIVLENQSIEGTWSTTDSDDDYFGFVFGYQDPTHFYVFDWKKSDQNDGLGFAERGMNVKLVSANSPLTGKDLWPTTGNSSRVQSLFHNQVSWEHNVSYRFKLEVYSGGFTIGVSQGDTLLAYVKIEDNTYGPGKFGFYNYSQGLVNYSGFVTRLLKRTDYSYQVQGVDPDGGALAYSLTVKPDGMSINPATGLITWEPGAGAEGKSHPVTVRVDDGQGGTDEQEFLVTVHDCGQTARGFDPVVEWAKGQFTERPGSNQVMMTPVVIDLDNDRYPEIVFSTYGDQGNSGNNGPGVLRAVSGKDGRELWTNSDPVFAVDGFAGIAAGDIDADGWPEIFGVDPSQSRVVAFRDNGSGLWVSPPIPGGIGWGSPSLADIDHDGVAEIIIGSTVLNADGTIRWSGTGGTGSNQNGPLSLVADIDMDGSPEIIAGNTVYHADGSRYWSVALGDGFNAIGNFDTDPRPEVVLVSQGTVTLMEHDGSIKWGPVALPGGGAGGAPTVADFDNDGSPEIGVAGYENYVVFETDGSVRWQAGTRDNSSNRTGSSVFDFDGDGQAEVVYGDEVKLRVYRGSDGTVLYTLPNDSGTTYEYPLVADVDNDGNAEIVAVANNFLNPPGPIFTGLRVIGDLNNTWVNTRKIWNQHTYHITNINDDGSIPRYEANSWENYNNYRLNALTEGFDPRASADLVISSVVRSGQGSPPAFDVMVRNEGNGPAPAGVTVSLYDGNPAKGGVKVGTAKTSQRLTTGKSENLNIQATAALVNDLWAVVDPDSRIPECNEDNNTLRAGIDTDPVNHAPKAWRELAAGELATAINLPFRLPLPVSDPDGDAIDFKLVSGPQGLMVHSGLGVVGWQTKRTDVGSHPVLVKATDTAGNVTLVPFTVTVTAPDTAPIFTSAPPTGPATVGLPVEYIPVAQDSEQPASELRYSLGSALPGMGIDPVTGRFTWTPTSEQVGDRSITIQVSDGSSTTSQTFTLSVVASSTNRAPVLSLAAADSAAWLGRGYGAQAVATDADGDPVRYEIVSGPTGISIDPQTGVIRWNPSGIGSFPVQVRATDGRGGGAVQDFSVSVFATDRNHAPSIVSNPPASALHDTLFSYNLTASDPDGDAVLWQLVSGPQGASIEPYRGTLRWIPEDDQTGRHAFTVKAIDPLLAAGEQTFSVFVSCENQPAGIVSRPVTVAYPGEVYVYGVRAVDPEGGPLTFSLQSGPAGMDFTAGTSLLRWIPDVSQVGQHAVTVRVNDNAGNVSTQSFNLEVLNGSPNRPPLITSRPTLGATLGTGYFYAVSAKDPEGDTLSFRLTDAPEDMAISANGAISFTPNAPGAYPVTVEVSDGRGGVSYQSFKVTARANQAPTISPTADLAGAIGSTLRTLVRATDPENDTLTYALVLSPAGMSIDPQGRISWPVTGTPRTERVVVSVSDGSSPPVTDEFIISVIADTRAPAVQVLLSGNRVQVGGEVRVTVMATDNVGVASVTLTADGVAVPLDSKNSAVFPASQAGRVTFAATASDHAGNTASASADLQIIDPSRASDIRTNITRIDLLKAPGEYQSFAIDDNAVPPDLSYLSTVFGTITSTGQPLHHWRLLLARGSEVDLYAINPDAPAWREIGRGNSVPADGKLGTFDPTTLANDRYVLALAAYDITGAGYVKPAEVNVVGQAKLGDFRMEFTDLSLPLNGIPVQISRIYDTKESATSGDFGYGWSMGTRDARIRETVPAGSTLVPDKSKVYLTAPDGTRVGFTYKEKLLNAFPFGLGAMWEPYFVADAGHHYKLSTPSDPQSSRGGILGALGGEGINPSHYRLTTPDGMVYDYDQNEGLKKITDPSGNTVTFTANAIVHSGGRSIGLERDGQGRITAVTLPNGEVTLRYRYDSRGDLVEVRQITERAPTEKSLLTTLSYKANRPHYLDESIDPNGNRAMKLEYDPVTGRLKGVTDGNGNTSTQEFDPANFTETVRDARGNPTHITYNERGNITRTVLPTKSGDIVNQYFYEDPANPDKETKVINPRGFATTRNFDARGNILTETTAEGSRYFTYNEMNKVTKAMDLLGGTTVYQYNSIGDVEKITDPLGDTATVSYDSQGRVKVFSNFDGVTTQYADFCSCGRPLTTINSDGSTRMIKTNYFSQVIQETDELGNISINQYDNSGRLIGKTDAEGKTITYSYEGSNLAKETDGLGNAKLYTYDANGKVKTIQDAEGGITRFTYDKNSNLETLTDPVGNVTTYLYDEAKRLVEERDPLGNSRYFHYDPANNVVESIDRNGRKRTFEYDASNRLLAEHWWQNGVILQSITQTYDAAGNQLSAISPEARLTYTYDAANRMKTATTVYPALKNHSVTLSYTYDAVGNVLQVRDNLGVHVGSTYDYRGNLATRFMFGTGLGEGGGVRFTYRANGVRALLQRFEDAALTISAGKTEYSHYKNGLIKTIDHLMASGNRISNFDYTYDSLNRLVNQKTNTNIYTYDYDKLSQITKVKENGNLTEAYTYDSNGNRLTATGLTSSIYTVGKSNRYDSDGAYFYKYDKEGNLEAKIQIDNGQITKFGWDLRNRLVSLNIISKEGGLIKSIAFNYDAKDRRIFDLTNNEFINIATYNGYNSWNLREKIQSESKTFIFSDIIDEILIIQDSSTGTLWCYTDKNKNVTDLSNSDGSIKSTFKYSSFGVINPSYNDKAYSVYLFTGREWQAEVALYNYRARQYSPTLGRFISIDPLGKDVAILQKNLPYNYYSYVQNSPINSIDSLGLSAIEYAEVGGIFGAVFGGVGEAVKGGNSQDIAKGAIRGLVVGAVLSFVFPGLIAFDFELQAAIGSGLFSGSASLFADQVVDKIRPQLNEMGYWWIENDDIRGFLIGLFF